jgi:hypothetical protein
VDSPPISPFALQVGRWWGRSKNKVSVRAIGSLEISIAGGGPCGPIFTYLIQFEF